MERYWNDTDMMSKISQKMQELNVSPTSPDEPQQPKQKGSKVSCCCNDYMGCMCVHALSLQACELSCCGTAVLGAW